MTQANRFKLTKIIREEEAGYLRNLAAICFHDSAKPDAPEWMEAHIEGLYRIASLLDGFTPPIPAWEHAASLVCAYCGSTEDGPGCPECREEA